jgi:hypothetical protein
MRGRRLSFARARRARCRRAPSLLAVIALVAALHASGEPAPVPFSFRNAGREAGLTAVTVFGGREVNRYLLETTGSGVAMFD